MCDFKLRVHRGPLLGSNPTGISLDCVLAQEALTYHSTGPEVIKLFSCLAQMRLKFILFINVKMPTIVGILTFISRMNYRPWSCKPSISIYLGYEISVFMRI